MTLRTNIPNPEQQLYMRQRFTVDATRGLVAREGYRAGKNGIVPKGTLVGSINVQTGYSYVAVGGTRFPVSAVVWFLSTGQWPEGKSVGHRNNDRSDCRPTNLQLLDHRDVMRKARVLGPKTKARSGYRGLQLSHVGNWSPVVRVGPVDPATRRAMAVNLGAFKSTHAAALMWSFAAIRAGYLPEALNAVQPCYAEEALKGMVQRVSNLTAHAHPFTAAICREFSARMVGEWAGKTPEEIVASICKP